ncbi:MAG: hypothetical protein AB7O73_10030 [Bacteroidia bacterium]
MITAYIHLEDQSKAKEIAKELLINKLAAEVSIDFDNHVFKLNDHDTMEETVTTLITAYTKAILFEDIIKFVYDNFGNNMTIYSVPITQGNITLSEKIRNKTKPTSHAKS